MKTNMWMTAVALMLAAALAIGYFIWQEPKDSPIVRAGAGDDMPACGAREPGDPTHSPETAADTKMHELMDPSERIAHLSWVADQDWARSGLPMLRKTIVSDADEAVQLHAVEKSLELARREGAGATSAVVQTSLASNKGNTRARGLRAARENPDPNLVPTMIELVDNQDPYATMALNALAHTDSEQAHAKVFAVAQDASVEPKLRERAVALLAVTKEREARPLLIELANSEDETLSSIAREVLKVLNEG